MLQKVGKRFPTVLDLGQLTLRRREHSSRPLRQAARNRVYSLSAFPVIVPSLSWQNDRFYT
jgi:hypothetical protein